MTTYEQIPWWYDGKPLLEVPDGIIGFVYEIENLVNDRKYIGKKGFFFSKTKQVKGKKKKVQVESDWKTYYGSSAELITDFTDSDGPWMFKRRIIRLCKSKGEMSYFEAKYQFQTDALISPEYYNSWLSVRVRGSHMKNVKIEEDNEYEKFRALYR